MLRTKTPRLVLLDQGLCLFLCRLPRKSSCTSSVQADSILTSSDSLFPVGRLSVGVSTVETLVLGELLLCGVLCSVVKVGVGVMDVFSVLGLFSPVELAVGARLLRVGAYAVVP